MATGRIQVCEYIPEIMIIIIIVIIVKRKSIIKLLKNLNKS